MLPTVFERDATGFVIEKFNIETLWVFSEPLIARRLYAGTPLKLDKHGWQFSVYDEWHKVFPKASFRQLLKKEIPTSPFSYLEAFEDAQLLYPEMTYDEGLYTLVGYDVGGVEEPKLIPYDQAEQLSDINQIDFTTLGSGEAYDALKAAIEPMRDSVHGILFAPQAGDARRAQLLVQDFDWNNDGV